MKTMKKFFASLLVLCMVLALPNMTAFAETTGTEENPEVIETLGGDATQAEGVNGYWYSYTAPSSGYLQVSSVTSSVEDAYTAVKIINKTTDTETTGIGEKAYATAGDVLLIQVRSYVFDPNYNLIYDAATITWAGTYSEAGTAEKPDEIGSIFAMGNYATTIESAITSGSKYYYSYEVEATGKLQLYLNMDYSFPMLADKLNADITVTNGDVSKKLSTSTDVIEIKNPMTQMVMGTASGIIMDVEAGDTVVIEVTSNATEYTDVVVAWNMNIEVPAPAGSSAQNPIEVPETSSETPYTVTIPAMSEYYFAFPMEFDGAIVTVTPEDPMAYFDVCIGGMYLERDEETGVATGKLGYFNNMGGVVITIANGGYFADLNVTISVTIPEGTSGNPDKIEFAEGETEATKELEMAEGAGFYYLTWVAPESGYFDLTIASTLENIWFYSMSSDNEDVWAYATGAGSDPGANNNPNAVIYVEEGDTVTILVAAVDYSATAEVLYPAATLTLTAKLVDFAVGSQKDAIQNIENFIPVTDDDGNPLEEQEPVQITLLDKDGNLIGLVSKEVLEAAKENGVDFGFLVAEDVAWVIDASTLGDTLADIDLTVVGDVAIPEDMVTEIVGENDGYTISIAHEGDFGFTAVLALLLGDEDSDYTGMYANLFYYNETTGALEFVAAYEMEDANTALFEMTHASDYVIVMSEEAMSAEDNIVPETPEVPGKPDDDVIEGTGDFSSTMVYVIVLMGVALVAAGFVVKKRFA